MCYIDNDLLHNKCLVIMQKLDYAYVCYTVYVTGFEKSHPWHTIINI